MTAATLPPHRLPTGDGFARRRRPESLLLIAVAHAAAIWLFLQVDVVASVVHQAAPLMVAMLADPAPQRPPEPALPKPSRAVPPPLALTPPPEVQVLQAAPPAPPPAAVVVAVLPVTPPPLVQAVTAPPAPVPVQVAAAPAPPPVLAASAIRYRVPPAIEVPMASRRLGEAGTVLLRVLVDAQGLPRQVSVHKSSGFARLDEQALAAMRQARFQPVTDGGNAIEWVVIAPLQYEID
jgi:protein TonB